MDWDHIKVVLAVARGGNLTKAAQLLGMDQTTAGRRLTALEEQLGSVLFVRSKSGFVLTEQGQIVIERAKDVENDVDRLLEEVAASREGIAGIVRLMANNWMLERLAETVLPSLLADHPRLQLVLSGRLPPAPLHGEATLSLWCDAEARATETSLPLCRVPYATYRAKGADVPRNYWVQFRDDDAFGPSFSRLIQRRLDPSAEVRMTATDAHILRAAARQGIGNCILPMCVAEDDPELERLPESTKPIWRVLHLHQNQDHVDMQRVDVVRAALFSAIERAFGGAPLNSGETKPTKRRH